MFASSAARVGFVGVLLFCSLVTLSHSILAATFFVKIVDNATDFTTFGPQVYPDLQPAINNNGTVAFWGQPYPSATHGIFTGNGGSLTTIVTSAVASSLMRGVSINDAGTVGFSRQFFPSGTIGIYTGDSGPISTVEDSSGPRRNLGRPLINNSGSVAFTAVRDTGNSGLGSYVNTAGVTSLVGERNSSGALSAYIHFESTSVNASGQVAMLATGSITSNNPPTAIYLGNGGPLSLVAQRTEFLNVLGDPSINDIGEVSYIANEVGGVRLALYKYSGGVTTMLLSSGGATGISLATQFVACGISLAMNAIL